MNESTKTMIGSYGDWASQLASDPPLLSFRNAVHSHKTIQRWRAEALEKTVELIAAPPRLSVPEATVRNSYEQEGLSIDELEWNLGYGPPTEAVFLRPADRTGKLPGILGLHDHSAIKYFGWQKIAEGEAPIHPILREHRTAHYGGRSWANELAKRGFAVLVHDVFPFGSRRIPEAEVVPAIRRNPQWHAPPTIEEIIEYNRWAAEHESIVAKSLFSAGTTWPGVYFNEDRAALDYLVARDEVDSSRVGCCGLSGGGMRTAYLAGLDHRIRAAVCVGFMTTWRDFLLHTSYTHTWMAYTPLLARFLDFPELAALRVPLPLFVQNNSEDELFTLGEMQRAAGILEEVYTKAEVPGGLRIGFYPGPHKFDLRMQEEAFEWLQATL